MRAPRSRELEIDESEMKRVRHERSRLIVAAGIIVGVSVLLILSAVRDSPTVARFLEAIDPPDIALKETGDAPAMKHTGDAPTRGWRSANQQAGRR
ncbi:hypothetical protein T484DRAFT_1891089 [Baffinella frigidus]|nr:hypothetical protein T484DRAFT_1891089 [Cryptophyta sp. CCMP2293]